MFKVALTAVIKDEGFLISTGARRAQLCASRLLEWGQESTDNAKCIAEFAVWLIETLKSFLNYPSSRKVKHHTALREENYYKFQAADKLNRCLGQLATTENWTCPIFYQYVSNHIMEELIKMEFPVNSTSADKSFNSFSSIRKCSP